MSTSLVMASSGPAALRVYLQELQQLSQEHAIGLIDQLQEQITALRGEFSRDDAGDSQTSAATAATATSPAVPVLPDPEGVGGNVNDVEATFESLNLDPAWRAPHRNDDTSDDEDNSDDNDDDEEEEEEDEDENLVETGYSVIPMTQHEFEDLCALVEEEEEAMAANATNEDEASREGEGDDTQDHARSAEDGDLEAVTQQLAAMRVGDDERNNSDAALETKACEVQDGGDSEPDRTVYDRFALPVIFKAGTTGFEATKDYRPEQGDVIAGRYLVRATLGEAAFSVALRCVDLHPAPANFATGTLAFGKINKRREVCLKVVKNNKDFFDQSLDEIKLLTVLNKRTNSVGTTHAGSRRHILQLYDYFYFREHLILATELLGPNLYEFAKSRRKAGLPNVFADLSKLRLVSQQILDGLVRLICDGEMPLFIASVCH